MSDDMKIKQKDFVSANWLSVEAGTNCPQGGNHSHGGITMLKIDQESTSWTIGINVNGQYHEFRNFDGLELYLYGDCEADTIADALIFAGEHIRKTINENRNKRKEMEMKR